MGFADNIKALFTQTQEIQISKYGSSKEWFLSDAGRKALADTQTTVELTDYTYHYLKAIMANKNLLDDDGVYRLAFMLADSVANSNQPYAGKENLLNETVHPFIAYFQRMNRSLSKKNLCYEMLLILLGAVDPFNSSEWIYDSTKKGFNEQTYLDAAEKKDIDFAALFQEDYSGREDIQFIIYEMIWLIGRDEFFKIIA